MQVKNVVLLLGLLIAFSLAGCSDRAEGSQPVETSQVTMAKSYRFEPKVIQVQPGTTVTWTNDDNFTHDVHILGDVDERSAALKPGDQFSFTFDEPGEYEYVCEFHRHDMQGTIIVAP